MGASKSENYTAKQNKIASLTKALGHPARIAIMEYLVKADACICNDIVEALPLAQPTVSQHLKELKNAGLIKGNITGKSICYCIDERAVERLQIYFTTLSSKLSNKKECSATDSKKSCC